MKKLKFSIFNAQGSRVIIVVVSGGVVKLYMYQEWRRSCKRKDRMKLSLPPKKKNKKLVEKLVWVPVNFRLVKTSSYFLANFWTGFASVFLPI